MKHSNLLLIASLFALAACEQNLPSDKIFILTEENMPPVQTIEVEPVNLPDVDECINARFFVYQDSILLIEQNNDAFPWKMYTMNLNSGGFMGHYLHKGNGPGEVINCFLSLQRNQLMAHDGYKNNLFFFNLDSLMVYGQAYKPKIMQPDILVDYYDFLTDTSLLICNTDYLDMDGRPENATVPELLVTDANGKTDYKAPNGIHSAANLCHTKLATNIKKDRIFLGYWYKPQLTVLDTKLDTVKIIFGPDMRKKSKYKSGHDTKQIIKDNSSQKHVISLLSTEECLFVVLDTVWPKRTPAPFDRNEVIKWSADYSKLTMELHLEIYKFDWDGNLIARYRQKTGNRIVYIAGYSEPTNTLYVMIDSESGEWKLAKIKLDK